MGDTALQFARLRDMTYVVTLFTAFAIHKFGSDFHSWLRLRTQSKQNNIFVGITHYKDRFGWKFFLTCQVFCAWLISSSSRIGVVALCKGASRMQCVLSTWKTCASLAHYAVFAPDRHVTLNFFHWGNIWWLVASVEETSEMLQEQFYEARNFHRIKFQLV